MAVRGPGSWRCLVQHSENGSIPPVLMCGQGVCANVLLRCVLRYRGRWGQPLHLSSAQNYNTQHTAVACLHPPELSSGVPPIIRGLPRDLRQICHLGQKAKCSHVWAAGGDCSILSSMLPHHCTPKY